MLTPEMTAILQRTLPIDHIDGERIVLRGPANRGADHPVVAATFNPAFLSFGILIVRVLVSPGSFGEDLADASPHLILLLLMFVVSALVTVASIIYMRRRRTLRIALHRGQYLAHFYGPKGIDICLPLVHPFLRATSTESGTGLTFWKSPSAYKDRENRKPWRRHLRLWPMERIPELTLTFPDRDSVDIVPVPGAREADFIACWEWLLEFIAPARASIHPMPPRRVFRLPGAARMLREMSLHSFTNETLGLFWTTTKTTLPRVLGLTFTSGFSGFAFLRLIEGNGPFPPWVALVSCPVSTAVAILLSFRALPIVTTLARGMPGATIKRLGRRERIEEVRIGIETYDNQDQFLMFTPRGTLRGRHIYRKDIVDCSVFIEQFCKPPVDSEGVDIDV